MDGKLPVLEAQLCLKAATKPFFADTLFLMCFFFFFFVLPVCLSCENRHGRCRLLKRILSPAFRVQSTPGELRNSLAAANHATCHQLARVNGLSRVPSFSFLDDALFSCFFFLLFFVILNHNQRHVNICVHVGQEHFIGHG